jgi:multidrug efflux system membrane fusion protein
LDDRVAKRFLPLDEPAAPPKTKGKPIRRRRGWVVALALLAAMAGLAVWLHRLPAPAGDQQQSSRSRGGELGPQPVAVAPVAQSNLPIVLEAIGTVTSISTVTVRSQVSGQITRIGYTEGQTVHKGDFLAQIDDRNFVAALHQLQGQLQRDQALLNDARLDLDRDERLDSTAITRQAVDLQRATVKADEGTVEADQGQIDAVQVSISNCHITAPADGRVGLRLIDQGNYVTPGDGSGIVVITEMQPISVIFSLPEDNLSEVLEARHGEAVLAATLFDRNDTRQIAEGTLQTVDNQIDPTTGTVKLRAMFPNTDEALFPNEFVNVHLLVRTLSNVTVVPNAAVQHGAPGTFVYVVNGDSTVSVRPIAVGPGDAAMTEVLSGLSPGDRVVVDGVDRLKDGARVAIPALSEASQTSPAATIPRTKDAAGASSGAVDPRHHRRQGGAANGNAPDSSPSNNGTQGSSP